MLRWHSFSAINLSVGNEREGRFKAMALPNLSVAANVGHRKPTSVPSDSGYRFG